MQNFAPALQSEGKETWQVRAVNGTATKVPQGSQSPALRPFSVALWCGIPTVR